MFRKSCHQVSSYLIMKCKLKKKKETKILRKQRHSNNRKMDEEKVEKKSFCRNTCRTRNETNTVSVKKKKNIVPYPTNEGAFWNRRRINYGRCSLVRFLFLSRHALINLQSFFLFEKYMTKHFEKENKTVKIKNKLNYEFQLIEWKNRFLKNIIDYDQISYDYDVIVEYGNFAQTHIWM